MPLLAVVDSLESLPDEQKSLYIEGSDDFEGKFILNVQEAEGLQLKPVAKLQSALSAERKRASDLEKIVNGLKDSEGNLYDVAELLNTKSSYDALVEKGLDTVDLDTIKENMQKTFTDRELQLVEKQKGELAARDSKIENLGNQLYSAIFLRDATDAIAKAGGVPELLLPVMERHIKAEEKEGQMTYVITDPKTGEPAMSPKPGSNANMTLNEYVDTLKENEVYARCFNSDVSGMGNTGNSNTKNTVANSGQALDDNPQERLARAREAQGQQ